MKRKQTLRITSITFSLIGCMLFVASCCTGIFDHSDERETFNTRNTNYSASESFSHSLPAENMNQFYLNGINGSIDIIGSSEDSMVSITGTRMVQSDSYSDAEYHLTYLEVSITEDDTALLVKTDQPHKLNGRNYIVNYHVKIPAHWTAYVQNVNGNITIISIRSPVSIDGINGTIVCDDLSGNVQGELVNGKISADINLPENGNITFNIVNGPIGLSIQQNSSAMLNADVVNGSVRIVDLDVDILSQTPTSIYGQVGEGNGQITLKAVNGSIQVKGE